MIKLLVLLPTIVKLHFHRWKLLFWVLTGSTVHPWWCLSSLRTLTLARLKPLQTEKYPSALPSTVKEHRPMTNQVRHWHNVLVSDCWQRGIPTTLCHSQTWSAEPPPLDPADLQSSFTWALSFLNKKIPQPDKLLLLVRPFLLLDGQATDLHQETLIWACDRWCHFSAAEEPTTEPATVKQAGMSTDTKAYTKIMRFPTEFSMGVKLVLHYYYVCYIFIQNSVISYSSQWIHPNSQEPSLHWKILYWGNQLLSFLIDPHTKFVFENHGFLRSVVLMGDYRLPPFSSLLPSYNNCTTVTEFWLGNLFERVRWGWKISYSEVVQMELTHNRVQWIISTLAVSNVSLQHHRNSYIKEYF
jgi:hypothetical protein